MTATQIRLLTDKYTQELERRECLPLSDVRRVAINGLATYLINYEAIIAPMPPRSEVPSETILRIIKVVKTASKSSMYNGDAPHD